MAKWKIYNEDAVEWAKNYQKAKFHALLCDAPYHLTSIVKRFGKKNSAPAKFGTDGVFSRSSKGFMGTQWDGGDLAFRPETWEAFGEVLHPGAFGMAFSASRNWHRMAVAIEDAGFILHPTIFLWAYSQGFPKATNIAKQIEKWYYGQDEQRTEALSQHCVRCLWEADLPQTVQTKKSGRKALQSSLSQQGVSTISPSGERIQVPQRGSQPILDGRKNLQKTEGELLWSEVHQMPNGLPAYGESRWIHNGTPSSYGEALETIVEQGGSGTSYRPQSIQQFHKELDALCEQHRTQAIREFSEIWLGHRYGLQALKPAVEPIIVFQKPYEGKPLDNIVDTGAGALNIDGGRIPLNGDSYTINEFDDGMKPFGNGAGHKYTSRKVTNRTSNKFSGTAYNNGEEGHFREGDTFADADPKGRWPSNLILEQDAAQALDAQTGILTSGKPAGVKSAKNNIYGEYGIGLPVTGIGDSGGASRFFYNVSTKLDESDPVYYCGKVSPKERNAGLGEEFPVVRTGAMEARNRESMKGQFDGPTPMGRNPHPTMKPIDLMKYLATLLLPPIEYAPRRIFVPFSGVASEMIGAGLAGWEHVVGVEFDKENGYVDIAEKRLDYWLGDKQ